MGKPGQTTREKSGLEGNYWIKWVFFGLNVILSHQNALETVSQKVFVNSVLYVNSVNATEINIKYQEQTNTDDFSSAGVLMILVDV